MKIFIEKNDRNLEERIFSSLPGIGFKWDEIWPYVWGNLVNGPYHRPITVCLSEGEGFKPGEPIEFYHNYKGKERQFCPTITCVSRQCFDIIVELGFTKIYMDGCEYLTFDGPWSYKVHRRIDGDPLKLITDLGYYSVGHFLKSHLSDFQGEIVHWTNATY